MITASACTLKQWDFDFFFFWFDTLWCCFLHQKTPMSAQDSKIWRVTGDPEVWILFLALLQDSAMLYRHPLSMNLNCCIISFFFIQCCFRKNAFFLFPFERVVVASNPLTWAEIKFFLWLYIIFQECLKWSFSLSLHYKNTSLSLSPKSISHSITFNYNKNYLSIPYRILRYHILKQKKIWPIRYFWTTKVLWNRWCFSKINLLTTLCSD